MSVQDFAFGGDFVSSTNVHEVGNNLAPSNLSSGVSAFAGVANGNFK